MTNRRGRRARHKRHKARRGESRRHEQWLVDLFCRAHEGAMEVLRGEWIALDDLREEVALEERQA